MIPPSSIEVGSAAECAPFPGPPGWNDMRFRLLVEHSRDLICLHSPDGRFRYVSPSVSEMLGYEAGDLIGRDPYDFYHPEDARATVRPAHQRVLDGRVDEPVRYRFRHARGHHIWLETLAVPLFEDAQSPQRLTSLMTTSRDVTAQVQAAALQATSEERLRLALLATGTGIYDLQLPAQTGTFSEDYARILGYGPEHLAAMAAGWQPLVHPDDVPEFLARRRRVLDGLDDDYVQECRRMHASGRYIWLRAAARVIEKNAAGLPTRLIGTLNDVDERVRSAIVLGESQRRLVESQRLAGVGDWRNDVGDPRDRWSDEIYRILGLDPMTTQPTLETFLAALHPDDRDGLSAAEEKALADGRSFEYDSRVIRPDGSLRHIFNRTDVLRDASGRVRGLYGTLQDITERKEAEARVRAAAAALEHAQRLARVGSWQWQIEGDVVTWSRATYDIFGFDPGVPAPGFAGHAAVYDAGNMGRLREAVARALADGTPFEVEVEFTRGDGSRGWGVSRGEVVRGSDGAVVGMSGTLQDITDRKRTEIALRDARDQVRDLSSHLEDELDRERKRIALDVHDELGQMLTAMKLQLELIQSQLLRPDEAKRTAAQMRELIEETMEVTRNITLNLRPPALDLGLVAALEWLAEDFGLRTDIECTVDAAATDVALDDKQATALFRIAQESLTNVTRHARASRVQIRLARQGGAMELSIGDDGVGFDPEAARAKGHFGLLGMRERALRLGAVFELQSRPGAGCTVRVRLADAGPEGSP